MNRPDVTPRRLHGVDFTSAPRRGKPITVASGARSGDQICIDTLDSLPDWGAFEAWLARPGPWIAGMDFPFGLPREAVADLGWPQDWPGLLAHCQGLGRPGLREAFDRHREARPVGQRYAHRATDAPARSHSPMKLVNPPVALMFLEGAPRLFAAGITVPGQHAGDPDRVAVEAYPGMLARTITRASYKSDTRSLQTAARRDARIGIVRTLRSTGVVIGSGAPLRLAIDAGLADTLIADASGDRLDAVLAAMVAGWCDQRSAWHHGLPRTIDPIEGWIAGAPF
jgi:hypothetical protein